MNRKLPRKLPRKPLSRNSLSERPVARKPPPSTLRASIGSDGRTAWDQSAWADVKPTALLVLADGTVLEGLGFGATGHAVGEVCFNTAMTGYQEILTDPSYAGQIITFTFPHIGNVGTNDEDIETVNLAATPGARGVVLHSADRKSTRLNSSHITRSRMPSSA